MDTLFRECRIDDIYLPLYLQGEIEMQLDIIDGTFRKQYTHRFRSLLLKWRMGSLTDGSARKITDVS